MNIGLGIILIPIAIIFILFSVYTRKKNKKIVNNGFLLAGTIIILVSILLPTEYMIRMLSTFNKTSLDDVIYLQTNKVFL
ncbi:hypothetical protein J6TS2_38050 [Heyndrickxia sporothermodurans]|nr:hypothetical protein J6TS2_38050 [Heyndrickxia sporothermodurans]